MLTTGGRSRCGAMSGPGPRGGLRRQLRAHQHREKGRRLERDVRGEGEARDPKAKSATCDGKQRLGDQQDGRAKKPAHAATRLVRHVRQDSATGARVSASRASAAPQSLRLRVQDVRPRGQRHGEHPVPGPVCANRWNRSGRAVATITLPFSARTGTASAPSARSRGMKWARRGSGSMSRSETTGAPWTWTGPRAGPFVNTRPPSGYAPSGRSSSRAVASLARASASEIRSASISIRARIESAARVSVEWGSGCAGASRRCGVPSGLRS
jgi:hypothetical protein